MPMDVCAHTSVLIRVSASLSAPGSSKGWQAIDIVCKFHSTQTFGKPPCLQAKEEMCSLDSEAVLCGVLYSIKNLQSGDVQPFTTDSFLTPSYVAEQSRGAQDAHHALSALLPGMQRKPPHMSTLRVCELGLVHQV